jgi:signal peptidase I
MRKRHLPPLSTILARGIVYALAIGALIPALSGCGGSGHSPESAARATTATSPAPTSTGSGTSTSTDSSSAAGHGTSTTGAAKSAARKGAQAEDVPSAKGGSAGSATTGGGTTHSGGGGSHATGHRQDGGKKQRAGRKAANHTVAAITPGGKSGTGSGSGSAPNAEDGLPFEVRIPSMEPTYKALSTVYYNPTETHPQIGQAIIFYLPAKAAEGECASPEIGGQACAAPVPGLSNVLFISRVVGLAGETIAVRDGRVIRNGQPVSEPSIQPCGEKDLENEPGCEYPKAITVPLDSYYVLGDDRSMFKNDSRAWGAVPQAAVVGTVVGS